MAVLRKIWAVYAILLFLLLMTVSLPVIVFNMIAASGETALRRNIYFLHHVFTPSFLTLIGIRLQISGREHLDAAQSYIIVSNHSSSLDFIVNAAAFPGVFRFLAKQELVKIPVFGWVVKKMCLIVDRSSTISRARSLVTIKQQLAQGWSIFIYPEGSRNRTDEPLGTFYDGAFRVAIQMGAPLVVQTVANIHEITATAKAVDLRPGVVKIIWDAPIATERMKADDIPELKDKVRALMLEKLAQYHI